MSAAFNPPANLTDFDPIPDQREAWDLTMASYFAAGIKRTEALVGEGRSQFFDPTRRSVSGATSEETITWNGFPKRLLEEDNPYAAAERLASANLGGRKVRVRLQDEYLEWHPTVESGKITAVDFTCEGPEYWIALAHGYPADLDLPADHPPAKGDFGALVELYRKFVSPQVTADDLKDNRGRYDPHNRWNTTDGAMHLTHPSNSLVAEVFLAADATVLRERGGRVLEDDDELIRCANYGEAERASDPTIGGGVNSLARGGALVGLRNPVGLYIDSIDTTGWSKPDGTPVDDYWRVLRPEGDRSEGIVRARYEVPESEGFTVSDIKIGGEAIEFAGQIAEHITMKLTGVAAESKDHLAEPVPCEDEVAPVEPLAVGPEHAKVTRMHGRRRVAS